jgi:hypothetical protein
MWVDGESLQGDQYFRNPLPPGSNPRPRHHVAARPRVATPSSIPRIGAKSLAEINCLRRPKRLSSGILPLCTDLFESTFVRKVRCGKGRSASTHLNQVVRKVTRKLPRIVDCARQLFLQNLLRRPWIGCPFPLDQDPAIFWTKPNAKTLSER